MARRLSCVEDSRHLAAELAAEVDTDEILEPTRTAFRAVGGHQPLYAQIHTWIKTYLECSILTKIDRASMMHSLEVRAPSLDPDLADFMARLPPHLIFRRGRGKVLLRRVAQRRLPLELLDRPKKGLGVPQTTWFRTVLRDRLEDCLDQAQHRSWFRPEPMRRLWLEHQSGRADHRRLLWNFLFSFPFPESLTVSGASRINLDYYQQELKGRDDYWRFMAAPRFRVRTLLKILSSLGAGRLVDLGCGNGLLLSEVATRFPSIDLAGIDLSPQLIAKNRREQPQLSWFTLDLGVPVKLPNELTGQSRP